MTVTSRLLSVPQAAERLGLSPQRVHELMDDGRLRATRVGVRGWVLADEDVEAFAALERKPGRPPTPRLRFKARYVDPILTGRKTQTMRAKIPRTIRPGVVVSAECRYGAPAFARLRVVSVREVAVSDLTDEDAIADGFASVDVLRDELHRLYPSVDRVYVIAFEIV